MGFKCIFELLSDDWTDFSPETLDEVFYLVPNGNH